MPYLFAKKTNYEDYASGRVIYHQSGLSTFPVRLASEIFERASAHLDKREHISLYDPLCGQGYLLTVLGLLHGEKLASIHGSDINESALQAASKNLSLLGKEGLLQRQQEISALFRQFQKSSHQEALESVSKFIELIEKRQYSPQSELFHSNLLESCPKQLKENPADIIITDVPYGSMVDWQGSAGDPMKLFLKNISEALHSGSVLAISFDKSQKVRSPLFKRLERFQVGKRRIELLRLS
jgi:tRNA G10  N-methylase Trm11